LKKLSISLIALAAISTASFASQRGYDLRDSDTCSGKHSAQLKNTNINALAVVKCARSLTAFERMMKRSEEGKGGRNDSRRDSPPSEM
jgi:hypothetical protein